LHSVEVVRAAHAMAGWCGDPTVSWSVLLHAKLDCLADPVGVAERLAAVVAHYPHLGPAPGVHTASNADWPAMLTTFADQPYLDGFPLVRVAVGTTEPRLAIAAHHCVTNGLGLLALLGAALDTTVTSTARGIGDRPSSTSSGLTVARRLTEALLRPPARIARRGGDPTYTGDVLTHVELPAARVGTGDLVAAAARAVEWWNQRESSRGHHGRHVAGVEVSRRGGSRLSPKLDSAFLRVPLPADPSGTTVRRTIAECPPEPVHPRTRSKAPQPVAEALARRLGPTFLVSNLGRAGAGTTVHSLAFHPTASGRSGIAIGAATAGATTTITMRARRADFDSKAARELLDWVVEELELDPIAPSSDRPGA
jgi:hypothetical protein